MAYNNAPDILTVAEIERYGRDAAALAQLREDDHEAWSECVCYADNIDNYRTKRLKRRDTNLARNVIKPVPQAAPPASRLNREDAGMLCRGIAKAVRRFVEEKTSGLASAERVAEIENRLMQENAELKRQLTTWHE